ncbi:EAL domain-containing protein [Alcaligenes sp. Lyrl_28]|uniref:EAL domain-containing protein n=1 Tax=Alcaligenes sp. Lyrl_28 TaxID=3110924 RepID=UPI003F7C4435
MLITRAVLLDALRKDQVQAWLQPKVSVRSQQLVALEALARWRHPQWGVLPPDVFLPWFRDHGLDEALLLHMLQEVLGLQAYWLRQGLEVPVAVNLPTHLLDDVSLPDRLMSCVQDLQGQTSQITLELLENSNTRTPCALFLGASRLAAMGFVLAQDDAGVAHSSMERLMLAPISELKLDRQSVNGLAHSREQIEQVQGWIKEAKQRGLRVTAEGVEHQKDLDCLRQMGCDYAQGYLFAKPAPAFELDMWMRQHWRA